SGGEQFWARALASAQNSRSSSRAHLRGGRQQYLEIITAWQSLAALPEFAPKRKCCSALAGKE
ncbi:MAG: hypothetical protein WC263_04585, partial [Candidatus Micrarchaeia archaeon]